jgi:alkylation response protein AidB-like acyl-CoA dehydrogenase
MLDESIARFATVNSDPSWASLSQSGWLGLALPQQHGGYGAAIGDLVAVMQAAGANSWRLPLIQCLGEACGALMETGPGATRDGLLESVASGEVVIGLCGLQDELPIAERLGDGHSLTGTCHFLIGGSGWDHILVVASLVEGGEMTLFAVDRLAAGLTVQSSLAIDGGDATDLHMNSVAGTMLGPAEHACAAARRRALILAGAEAYGISSAAFEATCLHLTLRKQFGQPIIHFQAVRHRLVELYILGQELGAMLEAACDAYDNDRPGLDETLWRLRAQSARTALATTEEAIQLHGGMGMTCELPIGQYYTRALLLNSLFGSYRQTVSKLSELSPVDQQSVGPL